ncbi:T9SS C-terminal target domain-containing protein [Sesbania bispinosa]|nr:T9SS C-terminal target domain-containing protein [Sesbania bispinosa]
MEDYLLRNQELFPVPMFKSVRWNITWVKDPGGYPEAEVLTFQKNAKSIFSKDNSTLCSSLGEDFGPFLFLLALGGPNPSLLLKKAVVPRRQSTKAT